MVDYDPGSYGDSGLPWDSPFTNPSPTPLVIDLDGDGIELISLQDSSARFDLDENGFAETTAWVGRDDGLLTYDVNGNGVIDDKSELFGDSGSFQDGFASLASLDDNGDGKINALDSAFSSLTIWRDENSDGYSDTNELYSLETAGLLEIDLNATGVNEQNAGNQVIYRSDVSWSDGTSTAIEDVLFETDQSNSSYILPDNFQFNPIAFDHPVIFGLGNVASSWVRLSEDPTLLTQSTSLLQLLEAGDVDGFLTEFRSFLFAWAGVSTVDETGRGDHIDGRDLAFMESIYGVGFQQLDRSTGSYISNPTLRVAQQISEQFDKIVAEQAFLYMAQSPISTTYHDAAGSGMEGVNHPLHALGQLALELSPANRDLSGDATKAIKQLIEANLDGRLTDANFVQVLEVYGKGISPNQQQFFDELDIVLTELDSASQIVAVSLFDDVEGYSSPGIVQGTSNDDNLTATGTRTLLQGLEGDDVLNGSGHSDILVGGQGNDLLLGGDGNNFLTGGFGNDTLVGGKGSDSYFFSTGEGNDTIAESYAHVQENDRLVFGEGITADDLYAINTHTGGNAGVYDLKIGLKTGDGTITILDVGHDHRDANYQHINEFVFSDGTTMTWNEFRVATLGTAGDDHFDGSGVDDDYVFRGDEGNDTIAESYAHVQENDRLVFGEGITAADLFAINTHTGGNAGVYDLTIGLKNGDGTITILDVGNDHPNAEEQHINEFVFSDGTVMTRNEFRVATMGTAGDDHFDGTGESDDYVFRGGEGNDTIAESYAHVHEIDRLVFGEGITAADLYAINTHTDGNAGIYDLTIGLKTGDGTITILDVGNDHPNAEQQLINEFVFSDGTVMTRNEFRVATMGTAGDDHFDGTGESDDYVFRGGEGNDTIAESYAHVHEIDRLVFGEGIDQADVFSFRSDMNGDGVDDLVIGVEGMTGSMTVLSAYANSNPELHQLDEFVFADGTTLDQANFLAATFDQEQENSFLV
ncbi:calcium-binding protein [Ruegeria sp. EL01]|uniref:calcium-binding protein n=1 Tax=Ruegeria sp. EL01 TaxID=2107578 RepID=UPI00273A4D1C|nr:calcium-binding protein [Ruegeria sp. EL01]